MHNGAQMKASNNGEKSQISRDLQRQIRKENGRLRENFRSKFRRKASNKAKKKKQKSHKKNTSFTETLGQLTSFSSCNLEPKTAMNLFSFLALLCCFAVYKARSFVLEGLNPFEISKHSCAFIGWIVSCGYDETCTCITTNSISQSV